MKLDLRAVAALALTATVLALLSAREVRGYAHEVHRDFFDLAFEGRPENARQVTPPDAAGLEAFRRFVYQRAAQNARFRGRWPSEASFDAAAFKDLLQLNPAAQVVALDVVPAGRGTDVRTVVREGSVDPDLDLRNQNRLLVRGGQVALDPFGRAVPYDPRTVDFGSLTGIASQYDAHGAMLRSGEKRDSFMTAIRHPEQFARPAEVLGSAPEFTESYAELAMIAKLWGGPGAEWLALSFGGNALHGIEDVGNQIHTTQIGTWKFWWDAKRHRFALKLKRMFKRVPDPAGYTAPSSLTPQQVDDALARIETGQTDQVDKQLLFALGREPKGFPTDREFGVLIIGAHHRLVEDFVQDLYLESRDALRAGQPQRARPEVVELLRRAKAGDKAFEDRCRAALRRAGLGTATPGETPYGKVLTEVMVEASAPEAQAIYEAIRAISKPELKQGGNYHHTLGHKPLDFVTATEPSNEDVRTIWDLNGRAFARVVTAVRLWDEVFAAETAGVTPGSPAALDRAGKIVDRLVAAQLDRLEAAEQRRAAYLDQKQREWQELQRPKEGLWQKLRGWFR
ncbi:MAG: hypothetical protein AB7N76_17355 [Planctomycetota bacterium]